MHGADTARLDLTPQSAGLYAISLGLSRVLADDQAMLQHGLVMYDALYAWCREGRDETHNWPPKMPS
ncbi:Chromate resistance exported protein [compost metagenome]